MEGFQCGKYQYARNDCEMLGGEMLGDAAY